MNRYVPLFLFLFFPEVSLIRLSASDKQCPAIPVSRNSSTFYSPDYTRTLGLTFRFTPHVRGVPKGSQSWAVSLAGPHPAIPTAVASVPAHVFSRPSHGITRKVTSFSDMPSQFLLLTWQCVLSKTESGCGMVFHHSPDTLVVHVRNDLALTAAGGPGQVAVEL